MRKNWFFILMLSIGALALAGTAAYFSVFGLSKLFYSAGLGITILAASLEFAKLVTVSYVYRFWKTIKKGLRGFYIFAVVFIMLLTSIGIYGFLTGAYQQSANAINMRDSKIQLAESKKQVFVNQIVRINESIERSSDRISTLSEIRTSQETRMDSLYARNYITYSKRVEEQINNSDKQILELNDGITEKMGELSATNDSIAFYDEKIIELNMSDVSNEVGPYKFVANLTGIPMDRVVNLVALLIVLVFDPLAIALLIGVNQLTMLKPEKKFPFIGTKRKEEEEEEVENKVEVDKSEKEVEEFLATTTTQSPTTTNPVEVKPVVTTTKPVVNQRQVAQLYHKKSDDSIQKVASINTVKHGPIGYGQQH